MAKKYKKRLSGTNREHGATEKRVEQFRQRIKEIEAEYRPNKALIDSDIKSYKKEYAVYKKKIEGVCKGAMKWIGINKTKSIHHGRNLISKFRHAIDSLQYTDDWFEYDLKAIKEKYPKHARKLSLFEGKSIPELSFLMTDFKQKYSGNVPDSFYSDVLKMRFKHPAYTYLRMSQSMRDAYSKTVKEATDTKNTKSQVLKIQKMRSVADYVIKNRKTASWEALVCAVTLATGRRPIEVVKLGTFKRSPEKGHIMFTGQAKVRGLRDADTNHIPVVAGSVNGVCEAVTILRKMKDYQDIDNESVNNRTARPLNDYARQMYGVDFLDLRLLRTTYTSIIEREFYPSVKGNDERRLSKAAYLAEKLGHGSGEYETFLRYSWITPDWTEHDQEKILLPEDRAEKSQESEIQRLIKLVESKRADILSHQKRGDAYEKLIDFVLNELKDGRFITKTQMERPDGKTSVRSRSVVNNFVKAVGEWPKKI